jgi:hypothetical protein
VDITAERAAVTADRYTEADRCTQCGTRPTLGQGLCLGCEVAATNARLDRRDEMKGTPPPAASTIETETVTETLDCKLTDTECLHYGRELANLSQQVESAESRKKAVVKELDSNIASLEARGSEIAAKLNRGAEMREVKVTLSRDYERGVFEKIREDTGDTYFTRPLRDDERQRKLPGANGGSR